VFKLIFNTKTKTKTNKVAIKQTQNKIKANLIKAKLKTKNKAIGTVFIPIEFEQFFSTSTKSRFLLIRKQFRSLFIRKDERECCLCQQIINEEINK
jgi:hypothetical protein